MIITVSFFPSFLFPGGVKPVLPRTFGGHRTGDWPLRRPEKQRVRIPDKGEAAKMDENGGAFHQPSRLDSN